MNIKIVNPIPDNLVEFMYPFGSAVYGTSGPDSDFDFVVSVNLDLGSTTLQWSGIGPTGTKVDYTYVGTNKFEELSTNGSNNALFEANYIRTTIVSEHKNVWKDLEKFYTYESEKLYLGLAKRDLDYPDRIHHVRRSLWIAEKLANKDIIDFSQVKDIPDFDYEPLKDKIKRMRKDMNVRWKKV